MQRLYVVLILVLCSFHLLAQEDETGIFSARIAKINEKASLVRFKVDFSNFRYLN